MAKIINIKNEDDFYHYVSSNYLWTFVDFGALWCGACKRIHPFVEDLAKKHPHVKFLSVDIDVVPDLANDYDLKSVPLFILFKGGEKVASVKGADQERLITMLEKCNF